MMTNENQLIWQQEFVIQQSELILSSYRHWTGKNLLEVTGTPKEIARALFEASFPVFSLGIEEDPVYNYANLKAMELWERDWEQLNQIPARYSAGSKEEQQEEREGLLDRGKKQGYVSGYQGVRFSSTGKRIFISNLELWNLIDKKGDRQGQAATFDRWEYL